MQEFVKDGHALCVRAYHLNVALLVLKELVESLMWRAIGTK
jgi:hypothetical protein